MEDELRKSYLSRPPNGFIGMISTELLQDAIFIRNYANYGLDILDGSLWESASDEEKQKLLANMLESIRDYGIRVEENARFMKEYNRMNRDTG